MIDRAVVENLLTDGTHPPHHQVWISRACILLEAVIHACTDLFGDMSVHLVREYLILDRLQELDHEKVHKYLRSLPGYGPKLSKQPETVLDNHGYLQMQFIRLFSFAGETPHIPINDLFHTLYLLKNLNPDTTGNFFAFKTWGDFIDHASQTLHWEPKKVISVCEMAANLEKSSIPFYHWERFGPLKETILRLKIKNDINLALNSVTTKQQDFKKM